MTIVLPNVQFDTKRSLYTVPNGSGVPALHLTNIEGHIQPAAARHLSINQVGAVKMGYSVRVDPSLDILIGDYLTNIRLIATGQVWADDNGGLQIWSVIDAVDATPGILSYRLLVLTRAVFGGPVPV